MSVTDLTWKGKKQIRLDQLLLGAEYYNKNVAKRGTIEDIASKLFGGSFQRKIREYLHKNRRADYTCKECGGSGLIADPDDKNLSKFKNELAELALYEATVKTIEFLRKQGFDIKNSTTYKQGKKEKTYSAGTGFFRETLKRADSYKAEVQAHIKEIKTDALIKNPEEALNRTIALYKKLDKEYAGLFALCPFCQGTGYYDVGHDSYVGKQSELLLSVFVEKIKGRDPSAWTKTVSVKYLFNKFKHMDIQPQLSKKVAQSKFSAAQAKRYMREKINQASEESSRLAVIKNRVYGITQRYYEGHGATVESEVSFEQVIEFFIKIAKLARRDTGALKLEILSDLKELERQKDKVWHDFKQHDRTPFPGNKVIVHGATAKFHNVLKVSQTGIKSPSIRNSNNMFVYAKKYMGEWSEKGAPAITTYEKQIFGNAKFEVLYFPQRVLGHG